MKPLMCALAIGLVAACETGPSVSTDAAAGTDFTQYRTYELVLDEPPQGMNPLNFERIRTAIESELAAKGYRPSDTPDFAIAFTVGARENVDVTDYGPYTYYPGYSRYPGVVYGGAYDRYDIDAYTEGTLAIDIYDATTRNPVWHGVATDRIGPQGATQEQIGQAVSAVLAEFPPG